MSLLHLVDDLPCHLHGPYWSPSWSPPRADRDGAANTTEQRYPCSRTGSYWDMQTPFQLRGCLALGWGCWAGGAAVSGVSSVSGHHHSCSSWHMFWWQRDFLGGLGCNPPHLGLLWAPPVPLSTESPGSVEMKPYGATSERARKQSCSKDCSEEGIGINLTALIGLYQ